MGNDSNYFIIYIRIYFQTAFLPYPTFYLTTRYLINVSLNQKIFYLCYLR
jgi:hypothetical protein